MAEALRQQRGRQAEERLKAGPFWRTEWGLVFCTDRGEPLTLNFVLLDLKRILAMANLPVVRFHELRHSAASLLLLHGVPARQVMEILGHSSITLTQNTYQHVEPALREQAVKAQEAYLGG